MLDRRSDIERRVFTRGGRRRNIIEVGGQGKRLYQTRQQKAKRAGTHLAAAAALIVLLATLMFLRLRLLHRFAGHVLAMPRRRARDTMVHGSRPRAADRREQHRKHQQAVKKRM